MIFTALVQDIAPLLKIRLSGFQKKQASGFVEPEGLYTNEMYLSGMSSSMPEDVQVKMYRSVAGLENAKIVKNAYAIEYDCINPLQLKASLEFKKIENLFQADSLMEVPDMKRACQGLLQV